MQRVAFWSRAAAAALLLTGLSAGVRAEEEFFLKGGEKVIFFGDSITQAGMYVEYVEAFLATRFPEKRFEVINHGISSETISGTTEPDHDPPRPDAQKRFARDIAAWKPDVVVACFGMNDGNYFPFEPVRFEKYQRGVERLIRRTRDEAHAKLVLLTPPPYDPYRRQVGDPEAITFGYKFPAIAYDNTLDHYGKWLLTLRGGGQMVVDLHGPINDHLRRRRQRRVSFFLSADGVHPNPTGHWLMAQQVLLAWNAPALCSEVEIDAAASRAVSGAVSGLKINADGVDFVWTTPMPMPFDPRWDPRSIAIEHVADRLNRHRLKVTRLPEGNYQLIAGDAPVARLSAKQLAEGVDLAALKAFPTNRRAGEILRLVQQRQRLLYRAWRKSLPDARTKRPGDGGRALGDVEEPARKMAEKIQQLSRPVQLRVRLRRTGP